MTVQPDIIDIVTSLWQLGHRKTLIHQHCIMTLLMPPPSLHSRLAFCHWCVITNNIIFYIYIYIYTVWHLLHVQAEGDYNTKALCSQHDTYSDVESYSMSPCPVLRQLTWTSAFCCSSGKVRLCWSQPYYHEAAPCHVQKLEHAFMHCMHTINVYTCTTFLNANMNLYCGHTYFNWPLHNNTKFFKRQMFAKRVTAVYVPFTLSNSTILER